MCIQTYVMGLALCMSTGLAEAQADCRDVADSVRHIREVIVVARPEKGEVIAPQTLRGTSLQRLGSLAVADALRYFAGLQLKDYGGVGGIKTVDVRAMGSQHTAVFYDGIQLGNAQNGQTDLSQLSLDNMEEVALFNGQKSALLQPASDFANGASIYLRTRTPRFSDNRRRNLRLRLEGGSSDLLRLSTLWEERLSHGVSSSFLAAYLTSSGRYRFRYRRSNLDGTTAYDTTATRQGGDIHALRTELNLNGLLNRGTWHLKGYLYQSDRGIPGAIVNNVWRRAERQKDLNTFVQGRLQSDLTDRISTQWLAKYAFYRTHYLNRDTTQLPVDNRYWQQELYVSTANACKLWPGWTASLSYDFRWNKLNADVHDFARPRRYTNMLSIATAAQWSHVSLQGSLLATFVHDITRNANADRAHTLSKLTPAVFVSIRPGSGNALSFRAFAKKAFRMPTFNDLYYTNMGNARLRPESTIQYDVGLRIAPVFRNSWLTGLTLQADGYLNAVHDKIIAYPKGQQFRWTMLNLGKVHIKGFDLSGTITATPISDLTVTTHLQYTFQDARDVTDPATPYYKDQIPYVPRHSGTVSTAITWRSCTLRYSFIYTGERYDEQENISYNHLQPWYTSDLNLQYEFAAAGLRWRAMLTVSNLFNQHYEVIANYPMPGRNATIGVQMEL